MTATTQPATSEPVEPEPSVTYDQENNEIQATVIISHGVSGFGVNPPLIGIPGTGSETPSVWTVIWTVVPDSSIASVTFGNPGLVIPAPTSSLPEGVSLSMLAGVPMNPSQWQATITNGCTAAASFNYDIQVHPVLVGGEILSYSTADSESEDCILDPTIAVVKEPLG